mmetsp:Transcript_8183/g.14824  ORF Transcript_8183/g.14824 Transcript_8183/m.14824 type:complete len:87 (-) Transcript_8183:450-710(-)
MCAKKYRVMSDCILAQTYDWALVEKQSANTAASETIGSQTRMRSANSSAAIVIEYVPKEHNAMCTKELIELEVDKKQLKLMQQPPT